MMAVIERALAKAMDATLTDALAGLIEAAVEAHRVEADLHSVLEQQLAGLDVLTPRDGFDAMLAQRLTSLLERHRAELTVNDLKLATFTLMHSAHALIHAVVLERPRGVSLKLATAEIVRLLRAYLTCAPGPA
jgi:BMFP domain-containing protein YqiC